MQAPHATRAATHRPAPLRPALLLCALHVVDLHAELLTSVQDVGPRMSASQEQQQEMEALKKMLDRLVEAVRMLDSTTPLQQ